MSRSHVHLIAHTKTQHCIQQAIFITMPTDGYRWDSHWSLQMGFPSVIPATLLAIVEWHF